MRTPLTFAALVALAACLAGPASAEPYFHSSIDGNWTDSEYNDGICHYYYSRDASDGETHVNRYGDCSHIVIGPGGQAIALLPPPSAAVVPRY